MSRVASLPGPELEPYVSRAELARIMGVSVDTVDRLRGSGMPYVVWGQRSVRFRPSIALSWARAYRGEKADPSPLGLI